MKVLFGELENIPFQASLPYRIRDQLKLMIFFGTGDNNPKFASVHENAVMYDTLSSPSLC